jgi:hypothetical protein
MTQQSVGTYNPSTGKFTPSANSSLTQSQITAISSPAGTTAISNAAKTTATQGITASGVDAQTATNKANTLLSPNTAKSGSGTSGTSSTSGSTSTDLSTALSSEQSGTRNEFKGKGGNNPLVYPVTLKLQKQDVIKFNMLKYKPKAAQTQGNNLNPFGGERRSSSSSADIIGTVVLPIPSGISDSNGVTWGSDTLNPIQSSLLDVALKSIEGGGEAGAEAASQKVNAAQQPAANADVKTGVSAFFASAAVGTNTASLLGRTQGVVTNPNMELLFQAPTLRPFTFNFKLGGRSDTESQAIRSIIRFFKQGMSPIRTESQVFLKAPHTFQIQYLHKNNPHPYLNEFKECALIAFSVDYTPEGQYATYTDGAMVSYQLTMQFQELEPIFNDNYGQGAGSSGYDTKIGY